MKEIYLRLSRLFDRFFTEKNTKSFKHVVIRLALLGLFIHLGLIFLAKNIEPTPMALTHLDSDYLSALYTPFSFILFYEVFLLVLAIPSSTTISIARQYEIVSLIVLRNVFKDFSKFDDFQILPSNFGTFMDVLIDLGGGLLMFLLVGVFYHVQKYVKSRQPKESPERLKDFIQRKKALALLLAVTLFSLAFYNLYIWCFDAYLVAFQGGQSSIDVRTIFYVDLFSVMVFTDIVILLLSMFYATRYDIVIRNAGFVISTILIRFSLTIEKPYDVELGLVAMLSGVLFLLVYWYHISTSPLQKPTTDQ